MMKSEKEREDPTVWGEALTKPAEKRTLLPNTVAFGGFSSLSTPYYPTTLLPYLSPFSVLLPTS